MARRLALGLILSLWGGAARHTEQRTGALGAGEVRGNRHDGSYLCGQTAASFDALVLKLAARAWQGTSVTFTLPALPVVASKSGGEQYYDVEVCALDCLL